MTHDAALAFWYARVNYEVKAAAPADLKLERMRALLARLGQPQDRLRTVHLTGTKGKGSTAALLAAVLRAAGYRVGLFTSPHLVHVSERIQVDDQPITPDELSSVMAEVAPAVRAMEAGPHPGPTFFEIGTAIGLLHFVRRRADVAVVEVGLGGRFDSTNVVRPLVTAVTSVGFDHMAQLGRTLEQIAFQKAGILKRRVPAVSGVTAAGPARVIADAAAELGCQLWVRGRDFDAEYAFPRVTVRSPRRTYRGELGLLGEHQAANAAVAVAVVERLRDAGLPVPDRAIGDGLRDVRWPARVELLSTRPAVVLDTAHNVPSAEALVNTLRQCVPVPGRKACVFAVSADKPFAEMLRILAGYFDHFHLTRYTTNPRTVPPATLRAELPAEVSSTPHESAAEAWTAARAAAGPDDLVCVTGSMFLAGELNEMVRG